MSPEQITLVERTLTAVGPRLDGVAEEFYRRLFAADPALEPMFSQEPAAQRAKFADGLEAIMNSVRRHEEFLSRATEFGVLHHNRGVRAAHYRLGGTALLGALGTALGDDWTDEVEEAWRLAYNLTAEAMMAAAAEALPLR